MAYLHGKLEERILIEPPKNLSDILKRIVERGKGSNIGTKAKAILQKLSKGVSPINFYMS